MATKTKTKAEEIAANLNSILGAGAVTMGNDPELKVKYLTTSLLPFDIAMPSGLPRGRMTEVFGGPSSLKSYLALMTMAATQAAGGTAALLDTEHTFDPEWAEACGVDLDNLILRQPETGEQAFDIAEILIRSGVDVLTFDSIAAAVPQVERDKRLSDEKVQPGQHAKLFSMGLRKITAANKNTAILMINQTRMSIGVTFGNPEVQPGGKAPAFYASLRMRLQHAGKVNEPVKLFDGKEWKTVQSQIAQQFRIEMVKSKLSKPFGVTQFTWNLKNGTIDLPTFLMAEGVNIGLVTSPSKGIYEVLGRKVRGRDELVKTIGTDPELEAELECAVREHHGLIIPAGLKASRQPKKSVSPGSPVRRRNAVVRRKAQP